MNGVAGFPNTTTGILRSAQDDGGELLVAQANLDPTHDDKAVVNGAPGAARSAQDDGGVALVAQANPDPTHDDKAVVNGAPKGSGIVKATPAIWRVKGAHGTVYLFGSIHVMKPNVDWQTAQVKAAMAAAGTLYVEVANLDDPMAALPIAAQLGMDAEHPLSTKVEKSDLPLLDTAAKEMGLPGEAMLEPMQPWLVSTSLSVLPMIKAGYDPKSGIDMVMLAQAKRENKSVVGFETMEEQMHLLADAPEAEQVELLHQELTEMDKDTAEMNELVSAWEKGDVDKIAALENGELKAKHPAEYKRLAVDRNVKWAETLDGLLKDPTAGDVLVVVGAAHLAGPDSLMEQLKKRGWKVERE
ncbi:MAG TPA: TraB/GumN family protein [Acidobacteriaceae bacterium]|nr:TraB/GumN family protein [Acidobacteriaceae bacterium]